jgi:hypothetical protein
LNNLVAQDQRAVTRVTRPMLGFKSFTAVQEPPSGAELMPMLTKGPRVAEEEGRTPAEPCYRLAASGPISAEPILLERLHTNMCDTTDQRAHTVHRSFE